MTLTQTAIRLQPIGQIERSDDTVSLQIDPTYRPGLTGLEQFSHVIVTWWADQFDTAEYREMLLIPIPYDDNRPSGVFACRSPIRPNLLMHTVCEIEAIDLEAGSVTVKNIDAFDKTPILDLKAYMPVMDRIPEARVSAVMADWPEWVPEEGIGLLPHEL